MDRRKVIVGGAAVLAALASGVGLILASREAEAAKLQAAIQAGLPPGFWVADGTFKTLSKYGATAPHATTFAEELWFSMKYGYCDQSKWMAIHATEFNSIEVIHDMTVQIEMQPILDCIETHPDHYATVVRCLRKQGWT